MGKGGRSSDHQQPVQQQQQQQQHHEQQPEDLLSLPQFQPFLEPDFNAAVFTSQVLAASRTSAQVQAEELKQGVRQLEQALSNHVLAHHQELLQHARKLSDTEHSLQDVVLSVSSLQASVKRIHAEIEGPYQQVKAKTRQLQNINTTVETLRHLIHRLKLVQKLKQQLSAAPALLDLAKAAKVLTDIHAINKEVDLSGIEAAAADQESLQAAEAQIHDQAQAFLIDGMESLSQAKVGSALQVFFNLEQLQQAVDGLLAQHLLELDRSFKQALDSRHLNMSSAAATAGMAAGAAGPGGAKGLTVPAPGAAASWQERLWQSLRGSCDCIANGALAVWHLQRVVAKKRDPLTHVLFLDMLCPQGQPLLTDKYWREALRVVGDAFSAAARPSKGGFVRDALTANYPKLVGLLEAAFNRVTNESRLKGVPPAAGPDQMPALLDASGPFRDAYLAAALGRMQEVAGQAFQGSSRALPSPADVQKCIGVLHEELKAVGTSAHLAGLLGSAVGKVLRLMADRVEYMAAAGPELKQVALGPAAGGGANTGQLRNITLCCQLQEVGRSLQALTPRLPGTASAALTQPLDVLQATATDTVAPIFKAAMDVFESTILAMHKQQWGDAPPAAAKDGVPPGPGSDGGSAPIVVMETSAYVTDLANAIAVFRHGYLSKFVPCPGPSSNSSSVNPGFNCAATLAEACAGRILLLWVRHASLIRPLGQSGKLQLAKDLVELQATVGQGLFSLEAHGPANRCLRAFRTLMFTDDTALPTAGCLRDLAPSLVLQHCFSRLPASIKAPAERSGVSPNQYSRWLDQHTAADVTRSVASTLEAARDEVAAAAAADDGQAAVIGLMKQLCGMEV